jgi:hypothetical protein
MGTVTHPAKAHVLANDQGDHIARELGFHGSSSVGTLSVVGLLLAPG